MKSNEILVLPLFDATKIIACSPVMNRGRERVIKKVKDPVCRDPGTNARTLQSLGPRWPCGFLTSVRASEHL